MENVDQLFNASGYHHSYPHPQQQLYQFFPPQQPQQQLPVSKHPSPHPSPAPASIPASPHGLFLPQQQQQVPQDASATQDQREPELPVDQIQDDAPIDEEPLYVNAKQYYRILKRRVARARLEEVHRLSRQRKPYLHESRHKHAMRRPRGPGGRFLTSEEIAAQKAAQGVDAGPSASTSQDGDDDDDPDTGDHGIDGDTEMTVLSPVEEHKAPSSSAAPQHEQVLHRPNPALQPSLQPRPQLQIQAQQQQQQQHLLQPQTLLPPQAQPSHHQAHSPFDHPMSMGHTDLLSAYHATSQPATPAPVSPHPPMNNMMQQTQDHGKHDHTGHGHHGHTHHGHHRHVTASIAHSGNNQAVANPPPGPASSTGMPMRNSYPQMMHHVPHPHAHARHHHSYLNRAEQLYASGQGANMPR